MKVAIVGAGLSGLSCAYALKKHGIHPVIFEKESHIGDLLDHPVAMLRIVNRFQGSAVKYLKKHYRLSLTPVSPLKEITMFGPHKKTVVRGALGHIFKKNEDHDSLEKQIARHVNLPVTFNRYVNPLDIKNHYDYIVCASGNCGLAKALNIFTPSFNCFSRLSTVLGHFDTTAMKMWVNTEYAKNGYVHLIPYDQNKACLALSVNDISYHELDFYWKQFLEKEKIQYKIIETRDWESNLGFVSPLQIDNMYMIGNAGGLVGTFLGFGAVNAIESGFISGRCIAKNLHYPKRTASIVKDVKMKYELRQMMNGFDNKDYDRLITFLGLPVIKQLLYNNPLYNINQSAYIVKLYKRFMGISH